uniref:Uncharacterized protein n=1 Tax=viral metagenome TaxID=1070528 RepID=A0A6C0D5V8_9ZZZZ
MGSYYQSPSYLKGGKRKSRKTRTRETRTRKTKTRIHKGGFYPSVMSGVAKSGQYLLPIAFKAGSQLLETHFKKRKSTRKNRK